MFTMVCIICYGNRKGGSASVAIDLIQGVSWTFDASQIRN
jgi:hypothetical protein